LIETRLHWDSRPTKILTDPNDPGVSRAAGVSGGDEKRWNNRRHATEKLREAEVFLTKDFSTEPAIREIVREADLIVRTIFS
jgi:hypothetical protein